MPQHHGAIDEGLWVEPCHNECGSDDLQEWLVDVFAAIQARFRSNKAYAYVYNQQAAKSQHDFLKPRKRIHERPGSQETRNSQGDVPEHNYQRRRQRSTERMT